MTNWSPPHISNIRDGTWTWNQQCGICCGCTSDRMGCQGRLSRTQTLEAQPLRSHLFVHDWFHFLFCKFFYSFTHLTRKPEHGILVTCGSMFIGRDFVLESDLTLPASPTLWPSELRKLTQFDLYVHGEGGEEAHKQELLLLFHWPANRKYIPELGKALRYLLPKKTNIPTPPLQVFLCQRMAVWAERFSLLFQGAHSELCTCATYM